MLKKLRADKGVFQKDVAKYLGIDRTTYVKYERGDSEPNLEALGKLATYFDVTIDELLGRPKPAIDLDKFKTYHMVGEGLKGGARLIKSPKDNKIIYLAELAEKMEDNEIDVLIRFAEATVKSNPNDD